MSLKESNRKNISEFFSEPSPADEILKIVKFWWDSYSDYDREVVLRKLHQDHIDEGGQP